MNKISNSVIIIILFGCIFFTFAGCQHNYTPKPMGYLRIDLPKNAYVKFDTTFPFSFEYSKYAYIEHDKYAPDEPYWINIVYPKFKGRLHLSYKLVNNNLSKYMDDAHNLVIKHIPKSYGIEQQTISDKQNKVYGLVYNIKGSEAASTYQFWITDSTRHFLRGALYFSVTPNNDSLEPVIKYIKTDITHLLKTFRWKK
jgi:gliding motility-associated lipoprotein GldD